MILILNGAFGVGKTTVARLLRRRIAGSRVYNPEWTGSVLRRLPSFVRLRGAGTDDFQDIALWRKSVVRGTRLFRRSGGDPVIVPMAFSRRDYLDEITGGMREFDDSIKIFCLKAGFATIVERLARRGERIERGDDNWSLRRARECVEAHRDAHFGETVDTEHLSAAQVADEIMRRLESAARRAKSP